MTCFKKGEDVPLWVPRRLTGLPAVLAFCLLVELSSTALLSQPKPTAVEQSVRDILERECSHLPWFHAGFGTGLASKRNDAQGRETRSSHCSRECRSKSSVPTREWHWGAEDASG